MDYLSRRPPREPDYVIRHTAPPAPVNRHDDWQEEPVYERERIRHRERSPRSFSPPVRLRTRSRYDRPPEIDIYESSHGPYRGHGAPPSPPVIISNAIAREWSPEANYRRRAETRAVPRRRRGSSSSSEDGVNPLRLQDPLTANIAKFKFEASSDLPGEGDSNIHAFTNVLSKERPNHLSRSSHVSNVFRSEYTGAGHLEGAHSVSLTTRSDPEGESSSLFRWLHIKQDVMNLDAFSSDIEALPGLTPSERKAISRLLADVKKNSSRPVRVSKDATVRHMDPGVRQLEMPPSNEDMTTRSTPTPVTWLCIPYFSLEPYTGFLASSNPGSYPTQTLLQASYARIAYKRDMQQAARKIGSGDKGWCFHIPQLWCLVVGNSLLVTCGMMEESTLRDKAISTQDEVPRPPNFKGLKGARILVTYGDSVAWSIPAEECETFLAFSAHFRDLWPASLEFYHNQRLMSREAWPEVISLLRRVRSSVTFTLKVKSIPPFRAPLRLHELNRGPRQIPADKKTRDPESAQSRTSEPQMDEHESEREEKKAERSLRNPNDVFHVFSWIKTKTSSAADHPNYDDIKKRLEQLADLLGGESNSSGSKAFKAAGMAQRASVHAHIELQDKRAADAGGVRGKPDKRQAAAVRLFNTADVIYNFFFPRRTEGPTIQKYWGSIMKLATTQIQDTSRPGRPNRRPADNNIHPSVDSVLGLLQDAIPSILIFKQIMAQATEAERAEIRVPDDLTRAWPLIVMALIHSCAGMQGIGAWYEQLSFATSLIAKGMAELIDSLSTSTLTKRVSILPMDLVSLMSMRLLADTTGKNPNASETYLEYLQSLEAQIISLPSDRTYETSINHVQEELSVLRNIVDSQRTIFKFIGSQSRSVNRSGRGFEIMDPTGHHARRFESYGGPPGGVGRSGLNRHAVDDADDTIQLPLYELSPVKDLLVWECIDLLERKKKEFQGYDLYAQSLERLNVSKVTGTKDKQEQAIYIFTLVTIIFLPLSAVSSIFGMNTSDVRDMESGMWTYWAVAIPVTLLVILLGLWWMGELATFATWAGRRMRGQRGLSDEIPPPPYSSPQPYSTEAPERPIIRTRSVYRERNHRPPSPDEKSDYWRRDVRRREEEWLQKRRAALEREHAEELRLERERLEEEKMRMELEKRRREEEYRRETREKEEAEKRAARERLEREERQAREERRTREEHELRRARAELEAVRAREARDRDARDRDGREREKRRGQDADESVSKRAPYRDSTVEEYD